MSEPQIGKKYHVVLNDCCVRSEFTSTLIHIDYDEGYLNEAKFENGVSVTRAYTDTWEEVDD